MDATLKDMMDELGDPTDLGDFSDVGELEQLCLTTDELRLLLMDDFSEEEEEEEEEEDEDAEEDDEEDDEEIEDAKRVVSDLCRHWMITTYGRADSSDLVKPLKDVHFRAPMQGLPRTSFIVPPLFFETKQNMGQYSFIRDDSAIFYEDPLSFKATEVLTLGEDVRACHYKDPCKPMPILDRKTYHVCTTLFYVVRTPKISYSNSEYVIAVKDGKPHGLFLQVHKPSGVKIRRPLIVHDARALTP